MGSLDPEGPIDDGTENGADNTEPTRIHVADPKRGERSYQYIGRSYTFRRFITSTWGSCIALLIVFTGLIAVVYGVKHWMEYEEELVERAATPQEFEADTTSSPLKIIQKEVKTITSENVPKTAESYFLSGQYEMAIEKLNTLDPSLITSDKKILEALAHVKLNQREQALTAFKEATLKNETNANAYFHWGQYLRTIGDVENAIEILERATFLDPKNQLYRTFWGVARVQHGTYFSLLWEAEKAIFIDPAPGDWLMITAAICLDVGDTKQALRMMKYAEVRMGYIEFRQVLADPFFQRSRYDAQIMRYYMEVFL